MTLEKCRNEIDRIDEEIIGLIEARFRVSESIAKIKKEQGLPIENREREKELLIGIKEMSSPDLTEYNMMVYDRILEASKKYQGQIVESL